MANNLNKSQKRAVMHDKSHLLIVAGPGTGKTHTLTRRIEYLSKKLKDPQKILAITFTNKAADEMKKRLPGHLFKKESAVVGTFHSFCLRLLQDFAEDTGLPDDFKVAAPEEIRELVKPLWAGLTAGARSKKCDQISSWKSVQFDDDPPADVLRYDEALRGKGLLDFDDLLCESLRVLKNNNTVRTRVHAFYRFVCVDEYQDINPVQRELLKVLVGDKAQITAIGDPNQAIYGFRGANVRFFENFTKDFKGASICYLSENYRSATNILKACGQVIAHSEKKDVPELVAKIYKKGHLNVFQAATDKAEAEYVVHAIEKMLGGTSMFSQDSGRVGTEENAERTFGDIAVCYRLNNQRIELEKAFDRSGIPYQVNKEEKPLDEAVPLAHEKVSLMTLHAAKGLEFPVVFMVGCEENILPLNLEHFSADLEEERRLFYVGMTRAKEILYLTSAKRRRVFGQTMQNKPSVFISDIEEKLKAYEQKAYRSTRDPKRQNEQQLSLFG